MSPVVVAAGGYLASSHLPPLTSQVPLKAHSSLGERWGRGPREPLSLPESPHLWAGVDTAPAANPQPEGGFEGAVGWGGGWGVPANGDGAASGAMECSGTRRHGDGCSTL